MARGKRGLVQPGLKVRGREYLRLIYGPDYTEPANFDRLRQRNLNHKRSLALREYSLGLESLARRARRTTLHLMLDCGNLVIAHAGLKEAYHGRASGRVRSFALYGDTTGETDEYGLPGSVDPPAAVYRR